MPQLQDLQVDDSNLLSVSQETTSTVIHDTSGSRESTPSTDASHISSESRDPTNAALQQQITSLQQSLLEAESRNQELHQKLDDTQRKLAQVTTEDKTRTRLSEMLAQKKEEITQLQEKLAKVTKQLQTQSAKQPVKQSAAHRAASRSGGKATEEFTHRISELEGSLTATEARLQTLQSEKENVILDKTELESVVQKKEMEVHEKDQKIAELSREISALTSDNDTKQAELEDLQATNGFIASERDRLRSEVAEKDAAILEMREKQLELTEECELRAKTIGEMEVNLGINSCLLILFSISELSCKHIRSVWQQNWQH